MKKRLVFLLLAFSCVVLVSCLSTPESPVEASAADDPAASADPPSLVSESDFDADASVARNLADDASAFPEETSSGTSSDASAPGGSPPQKDGGIPPRASGPDDQGSVAVDGTSLSDEEARRLFGQGAASGVSVTADWDGSSRGNPPGQAGGNLADGAAVDTLVVSPADLHIRREGEDSVSVGIDVLSPDGGTALESAPRDLPQGGPLSDGSEAKTDAGAESPPDDAPAVAAGQTEASASVGASGEAEASEPPLPPAVPEGDASVARNPSDDAVSLPEETSFEASSEDAAMENAVAIQPADEESRPDADGYAVSEASSEEVPPAELVAVPGASVTAATPLDDEASADTGDAVPPDEMSGGASASDGFSPPVPSRTVTMDSRQYLDIVYPGAGWIYLGEVAESGPASGSSLLTYFGRRRNSTTDTSFTLRSASSGRTVLHFYKQDVLTATFIDDYIEVVVSDRIAPPGSRVAAPLYSDIVPQYQYAVPSPGDFAAEAVPPEEGGPLLPSGSDVAGLGSADDAGKTAMPVPPVQDSSPTASGQTETDSPVAESVPAQSPELPAVTREADSESLGTGPDSAAEPPAALEEVAPVLSDGEAAAPGAGEGQADAEPPVPVLSGQENPVLPGQEEVSGAGLDYLAQAQDAFYREDYASAAGLLDQFFEVADSQLDAGLYLKGQVYEAKSDIQNIRTALSAYRQIVEQHTVSPFWPRAKNRVTYLSRFYFDIR